MTLCGVGFTLALSGGHRGWHVTGIAISAMHYTGMAAVELPARAVWDTAYVTASVLIGVSLSFGAAFAIRQSPADYVLGAGHLFFRHCGLHYRHGGGALYLKACRTFRRLDEPLAFGVIVGWRGLHRGPGANRAIIDRHLRPAPRVKPHACAIIHRVGNHAAGAEKDRANCRRRWRRHRPPAPPNRLWRR
jgi:hypothetical protein